MTADDLLVSWSREVFRPKCNPGFQSLHCMARLDQDVSAVLPYLNADLGGDQYVEDPPAVTFQVHGKLITVYGREIAVNALSGEEEADKILAWLRGEINRVWRARQDIEPSYVSRSRPQVFPLLQGAGATGLPGAVIRGPGADGALPAGAPPGRGVGRRSQTWWHSFPWLSSRLSCRWRSADKLLWMMAPPRG
jgi:hypothetical protein